MSPDRSEPHDQESVAGVRKTGLNRDVSEGSTGAGAPEDVVTIEHQSDSLVGATVTLSSGDAKVIGNFRLTKRLGAGGFGIVYAADDLRLDRHVALKVPFAVKGEGAADYYKRVVREGRAAAALDHPNIVSVYEVGERNGQPYIVSQLIEGPTLYDRSTSGRIEQYEAAKLMALIARALAYAHRKGIVHRDMKPGNVLLDENGVPHVNDFGIAKYESAEETISGENSIIGTPAYMSPEQAAGHSRSADRRSDLYSLGVMLYELVTGERPFRGSSRMLLHQVVHSEPQPPRQLVHSIQRDLETICLKCLEKEPNRRYQDCDEMADELDRFLAGEAIHARPVSRLEHAWRKCRRYPVAASLGLALLISLLGGLAGVTWQWQRAEANGAQEREARREVERSRQELNEEMDYSNRLLYGARMALAANSMAGGDYQQAKNHLSFPNNVLEKYCDIEYNFLSNCVDRYESLLQHIEQVTDVAISDDESMIAACGLRTLLVWDVESGHVVYRAREKGKQLRCVAFAPESDLIAWSGQSGQIAFATPQSPGQTHASLEHGSGVQAIAFSDDGSHIFSAGDDGKIVIWSVKTKQRVQTIAAHKGSVSGAKYVDSTHVISGGQDRRLCLSDADTGECVVLTVATSKITAVAASDDGETFAAGLENTRMLVGEIDSPNDAEVFDMSDGYVVDMEFVSDRNLLVTSSFFGKIHVWNLPDVRAARTFKCVKGFGRIAISHDSKRMIVGAGDGAIEAIHLDAAQLDEIRVDCNSLNDARIVDNSRAIVVCPDRGAANLIHLASGRLLRKIPDYSDESLPTSLRGCNFLCVDESDDGKKLALGTDSGQILIWNVADAKLRVHGAPSGRGIQVVRFCGDASTLVSGGEDGAIRVWDLNRANKSSVVTRHGGVIRALEISPDGKWLLTTAADGSVALVEASTWNEKTRLETGRNLHSVAWSRDSHQIAMGDSRGGVFIYPSDLSSEPKRLLGHAGPVTSVAFSLSGATLITAGNDKDVRFWDLETGQVKMIVNTHHRNIRTLSLSQDGEMMISADAGGVVRIWPATEQDAH